MPRTSASHNRGPAAAAANRAALLAAARAEFAAHGYHVPLSRIARSAGVGQGVLYRHFPNRLALGFAVFEENFASLAAVAGRGTAHDLGDVWAMLIEITVTDSAFVEMFVDARKEAFDYDGPQRLLDLLSAPLERAKAAGTADPALHLDHLVMAHRMAFGVVATASSQESARRALDAAMAMIAILPPRVSG